MVEEVKQYQIDTFFLGSFYEVFCTDESLWKEDPAKPIGIKFDYGTYRTSVEELKGSCDRLKSVISGAKSLPLLFTQPKNPVAVTIRGYFRPTDEYRALEKTLLKKKAYYGLNIIPLKTADPATLHLAATTVFAEGYQAEDLSAIRRVFKSVGDDPFVFLINSHLRKETAGHYYITGQTARQELRIKSPNFTFANLANSTLSGEEDNQYYTAEHETLHAAIFDHLGKLYPKLVYKDKKQRFVNPEGVEQAFKQWYLSLYEGELDGKVEPSLVETAFESGTTLQGNYWLNESAVVGHHIQLNPSGTARFRVPTIEAFVDTIYAQASITPEEELVSLLAQMAHYYVVADNLGETVLATRLNNFVLFHLSIYIETFSELKLMHQLAFKMIDQDSSFTPKVKIKS